MEEVVMWVLIAAYAFAVGWNVHDQVTPREPIIKQEIKND
jgi:hypothetical protein